MRRHRPDKLRGLFAVLTLCILVGQKPAAPEEIAADLPGVEIVDKSETNGRTVVHYEHTCAVQWEYQTSQEDRFYLVLPQKLIEKPPLCVVLHSAGGNGNEALPFICRPHDRGFYGDETFYVLCLDCAKNKNDWWWGAEEIERNPQRYRSELCPTEKRVLSTVEWVIREFDIDRNRVYLNGGSMGGSGSLGIGLNHGDVFASVSVLIPAGVKHVEFRARDRAFPDPPPLINISSHVDSWSLGQEDMLKLCEGNRYLLVFAWGPFGHVADVSVANSAVYEYPWFSIRRNEAYPAFTHATTDNHYPGHKNEIASDQSGQINGYFRWKNIEDTKRRLVMELRLVRKEELRRPIEVPCEATVDITPRRLQKFVVRTGMEYRWTTIRTGKVLQSGKAVADAKRLLTLTAVPVTDAPLLLRVEPGTRATRRASM